MVYEGLNYWTTSIINTILFAQPDLSALHSFLIKKIILLFNFQRKDYNLDPNNYKNQLSGITLNGFKNTFFAVFDSNSL